MSFLSKPSGTNKPLLSLLILTPPNPGPTPGMWRAFHSAFANTVEAEALIGRQR